jgi:hypothetical protein
MRVQELGYLNAPIKGVRGLVGGAASVAFERRILPESYAAMRFEGEKLKPGEEVPVVVPVPNLPLNASVRTLRAKIEVRGDDDSEVSQISQTAAVKEDGAAAKNYEVKIDAPALPRNISVRLDGGEVFWSFADLAVEGEHELPDFVEHVNTYLDKLPVDSKEVFLRFLVKSDGPGEVKVTVEDIEYSVIQTQSWTNPLDNTIRLDRTFQLDFGSIERVQLDAFSGKDNKTIFLSRIKGDLGGEFGPERLLTKVEAHDGREFATVSSDYSLAQGFKLEESVLGARKSIQGVGVAGFFRADSEAEIYIEIQTDANGFPSAGAPLAKADLALSPPEDKESKKLTFVNFEAPVELKLDTPYWLVIKGIQGKILVGLQARTEEYLQQALVNRGGQLWKSFSRTSDPAPSALLRLIYLPEIDNQMAAVEVGIEGTPASQRFDPKPEAQPISFDAPQGSDIEQPVIIIKSHARGTLSIANVIQEYSPGRSDTLFRLGAEEIRSASKKE